MDATIKKLRNGENIQRLTTYQGVKQVMQIQLNKTTPFICWQRFYMPVNRDKSKALEHNSCLTLKEVLRILKN